MGFGGNPNVSNLKLLVLFLQLFFLNICRLQEIPNPGLNVVEMPWDLR